MSTLQTMNLGSDRITAEGDVSGFLVGQAVTISNVVTPQQFRVESIDTENGKMVLIRTEPTAPTSLDIEAEDDEDDSVSSSSTRSGAKTPAAKAKAKEPEGKESRDKKGIPIS